MTQEKKVQTAAVMDVTGIERAAQDAVRAAKTMADGITREGEKAGKGIEAMGEGATRAERTVDAKTKSISDRIRRLTVQSQRELAGLAASSAGGAGSAAAVEYEATIRGADVAKLQPQIAALRELQTQANALSAAMRQAMVGDEFIAGVSQRIAALQRQAAGAKMAEADMLALRAAELGVTQQADPLIAKLRATAAAAEEAAAATKRAAAGDSFLQGLNAQANAIGKTRADLLALKAAELGVAQQAAPMIAAIRAADGELMGMGKNAKLTATALRNVPAQFTDIVVSLQAGQNPLQVFLQQGGQLQDMFGGAGPAAQALGRYVLGLISPFSLAAGAVGVLAAAYLAAQSEQGKMQRALIETGFQGGVSAGQINQMASAIDRLGSGSTGKAIEVLTALARTGDVGADGLQRYAAAAIEFEKAGGQAADKTVEAFAALGREPVAAAARLNREVNFLTPSLYSQIKALEDQGRATDAARLAQSAYAEALQQRTPEMLASLGLIERAWLAIKDGTTGAWDALKGIGREATNAEKLSKALAELASIDPMDTRPLMAARRTQLQQEVDGLRRVQQGEALAAAAGEQRLKATEAMQRVERLREETLARSEKMQRELVKYRADANLANIPADQRAKDEAAIREKYADKGSSKADRGLAKAQLAEELQGIRSAEAERQTIYRQSEQIIDAQRRAGLLSEEAYFEARKSLAEGDAEARISALQQEILVMSRFKGTATEQAQVRKDIAAAAGRIGQASAEAIARDIVLRTDQTAAIEAQRRALVELQQAADAEYTSLTRRLGVQVRETGQGTRRTSEEAQLESTAADFTRRQAQLDAEYRNGRLRGREEQYRAELDLLIREEGRQLAAIEEFQRRKREADNDYRLGAKRGIENVIDGTFDTAARTARLTEDAFTGLGDALTDVFTKGKVGWSSLEQTILSGITRIIVEQQLIRPIAQYLQGGAGGDGIVGALGSVLGSVLGGGSGGSGFPDSLPTRGGRAAGGPVERGGLYEINETRRGPGEVLNVGGRQYLMALQAGYVQPVAPTPAAGQGRVLHQTNNFHVSGAVDRRTQQQLAMQAGRQAQTALNRNG